jgi:hypothetical protein
MGKRKSSLQKRKQDDKTGNAQQRGENVSLLPMHSFAARLHWLVHIFRQKEMENIGLVCIDILADVFVEKYDDGAFGP